MKKSELRKTYKEKRQFLSSELREEMARKIADRFLAKFNISGYNVSVFLPISRLFEINTWHIIENVNANFILPVVTKEGSLKHVLYESVDQLVTSEWGIPEPTYGEEIDPKVIDMVLVPLLVVDESGNRVGYGKGFYDQFLATCSEDCIFVGLSYFDPVEQIQDLNPNDIRLHFCVTPDKILSF
ncbi:MAG: 5-formyltetrahydrofolate cyclo-ligase [Crocinitomicaceae bacterium]|nr:5-formyltetrahydrofolate cyclo-ligase [Crocinitomicaceae bacterium]